MFILPGSASPNTNVLVASANNLSALGAFNAGVGAYQALAKPDGTKFYIVASSGVVTVVDAGFTNPRQIAALPQAPTAAAITPDGGRLLVVAGRLYIFETTGDGPVVTGGVDVGSSGLDVAVSLDGSTAFVIGTQPSQFGLLTAVSLASNTVTGQRVLPGSLSGISSGPNGFLYVTAQNYFQEFNPATLSPTALGNIPIAGVPGKLGFTPDGRFALAGDLHGGVAVFQFDLSNHALVSFIPAFGVIIDKILVAGNGAAYAYSAQTQGLLSIGITPTHISIGSVVIPGVNSSQVSAAVLSDDLPVGDRTVVQSLFLVSNGTLFRVDSASSAQTGQFTVGGTGGALSFAGAASTGPPANLYAYNVGQTIQPGTVSAPLVVRVLDSNGRPVLGAAVNFNAGASGATVQTPNVTTGFDGFAETLITAPSTAGTGVVTATVGGLTQNFSFIFGMPTPGGGAGESLTITSGQGQILFAQINAGGAIASEPLVVLLKDSTGAPAPNSPVTFTISQGSGSLSGNGSSGNSIVVSTDQNGFASVVYVNTDVQPGTGFGQAGVTASAGGATAMFFLTIPFDHPALIQFTKPQVGQSLSGSAGGVLKGAVTAVVVSSQGIAIPNISLHLDNDPLSQNPVNQDGSGNPLPQAQHNPHVGPTAKSATVECAGGFALSDSKGQISCDVVFGPTLGTSRFIANVGYFGNSPGISFTVTTGPPSQLILVSGNNQNGTAGQQLPAPVVVQVTDAGGNVLPNVPVNFQVVAGSATLSSVSAVTDANGFAQATVTLGNSPGPGQIRVSVGTLTRTFTFLVTVQTGGIAIVSGNGQSTLVNTAFGQPLVVKVTDQQGHAFSGAQVSFNVTSGSATPTTPLSLSDVNGQASTTIQAGPIAGTITVVATSGAFTATFTLTSRLAGPTNIIFLNAGSFQPGLSPGALVVVTGIGIATGIQGVVVPTNIVGPHPTQLAGVSVLFNGILSPIFSVSNLNGVEQVTVQVPFEIPPGSTTVIINAANGTSATLNNVQVAPYSPGIFGTNIFGPNLAVVLRPDGTYVTPTNQARQGEIVKMFVTGMGQVTPATGTNLAGTGGQTIAARFVVGVNDNGVAVMSSEYVPGLIGVYTVTFKIPDNATTGPNRPLAVIAYDAANNVYPGGGFGIPIAAK